MIHEVPPYEVGLPQGRWSLSKLCTYLTKQRVLKTISREHVRQVLKKGASSCAGSRRPLVGFEQDASVGERSCCGFTR